MAETRLRMRKGTRSCAECRRRKIRCRWDNGSGACRECQARGRECREQVRMHPAGPRTAESKVDLEARVVQLEKMIESMRALQTSESPGYANIESLGSNPRSSISNISSDEGEDEDEDDSDYYPNDASHLGLSDNAAFTQTSLRSSMTGAESGFSTSLSKTSGHKAKAKHDAIRQRLLAMLPPPATIDAITKYDAWWLKYKSLGPAYVRPDVKSQPLTKFVQTALRHERLTAVAIAIYCIAITLRQLRPGQGNDLSLAMPPNQLYAHYYAVLERELPYEEPLMKSTDGLEICFIRMHCFMYEGQPRKAWTSMRMAITIAELLGCHKKHSPRRVETLSIVWESIWPSLFQTDRYLSLLLGLPCCIPNSLKPDIQVFKAYPSGTNLETHRFHCELAALGALVVDRNEGSPEPSYTKTLEIDEQIRGLDNSMPIEWWDVVGQERIGMISDIEARERTACLFFRYQLQVYVHLPFMLRSDTDARFEYCRAACLGATRSLLELYHRIRAPNLPSFSMVKIFDFVGFTAAIQLLLGLFRYRGTSPHLSDISQPLERIQQDEKDVQLINTTVEILRTAAEEPGNMTAKQALRGLETLRAACEYEQNQGINKRSPWTGKVVVPYFGTINIAFKQNQHPELASYQSHEAVTTLAESSGLGSSVPLYVSAAQDQAAQPSLVQFSHHQSGPLRPLLFEHAQVMGHAGVDLSAYTQELVFSTLDTGPAPDFTGLDINWSNFAMNMDLDLDQDWSNVVY